jgi:prevent-host-death family protein
MQIINIHQAKTHLSQLVSQALAGEQIVIAKAGKPLIELTRYQQKKVQRKSGQLQGIMHVSDDFDAPLPNDIARAFLGESE